MYGGLRMGREEFQAKIRRILADEKVLTKEDFIKAEELFYKSGEEPITDKPLAEYEGVRRNGVSTVTKRQLKYQQYLNTYARRWRETKSESSLESFKKYLDMLLESGWKPRYNNRTKKGALDWTETISKHMPIFIGD